jgi:hypothetical protein
MQNPGQGNSVDPRKNSMVGTVLVFVGSHHGADVCAESYILAYRTSGRTRSSRLECALLWTRQSRIEPSSGTVCIQDGSDSNLVCTN